MSRRWHHDCGHNHHASFVYQPQPYFGRRDPAWYYCLPVAKREQHREALVAAATSGAGAFFLGTDSAPHLDSAKLTACGCAGIYTAPVTMSCLAQMFELHDALDRLEAFTSLNGPAFYRLPVNQALMTLTKQDQPLNIPASRRNGEGSLDYF